MGIKYFIGVDGFGKKEITKKEWIRVERQSGFRPKMSSDDPKYMDICATGGFSSGIISGSIEYDK